MIWDEDDPRFNALMRLAQSQEGMPATSGSPQWDQSQLERYRQYKSDMEAYGQPPVSINDYFKPSQMPVDANIPKEQTSGIDKLLSAVGSGTVSGKALGGPDFSSLNKRGKFIGQFGKK